MEKGAARKSKKKNWKGAIFVVLLMLFALCAGIWAESLALSLFIAAAIIVWLLIFWFMPDTDEGDENNDSGVTQFLMWMWVTGGFDDRY